MTTAEIARAVEILRSGRLVAFPTETVYGLGADATNAEAVRRIFAAKGRPGTNPLIVHVADAAVARRYARVWPEEATELAERFWPGPLTIILPKQPVIVDEATAGLDTVGLRVPNHPLALEMLRAFDGPVAAPSANRSTRVSPTTAEHVRQELGDAADFILDGGPCAVGIESTVLDLSGGRPAILRPGAVTREQIEEVIGPVEIGRGVEAGAGEAAKSPGQHLVHYSPRATTWWFEAGQWEQVRAWCASNLAEKWAVVAITRELRLGRLDRPKEAKIDAPLREDGIVRMPADPASYGRYLYATLRRLDEQGVATILIELPPDADEWAAIRDRLTRAGREFVR